MNIPFRKAQFCLYFKHMLKFYEDLQAANESIHGGHFRRFENQSTLSESAKLNRNLKSRFLNFTTTYENSTG